MIRMLSFRRSTAWPSVDSSSFPLVGTTTSSSPLLTRSAAAVRRFTRPIRLEASTEAASTLSSSTIPSSTRASRRCACTF